jgi:hypothetical protein
VVLIIAMFKLAGGPDPEIIIVTLLVQLLLFVCQAMLPL